MAGFFVLLFLIAPVLGIYFFIRKQQFNTLFRQDWSRKKILGAFILVMFLSFVGVGITADTSQAESSREQIKNEELQQAEIISEGEESQDPITEMRNGTEDQDQPETQADTIENKELVPTPSPSPSPSSSPRPTPKPSPSPKPSPAPKKTTAPSVHVVPSPKPAAPVVQPPVVTSGFSCNCKKTCTQIISCEEAYYQLTVCGCKVRDGDNDGVPCEDICPGG